MLRYYTSLMQDAVEMSFVTAKEHIVLSYKKLKKKIVTGIIWIK